MQNSTLSQAHIQLLHTLANPGGYPDQPLDYVDPDCLGESRDRIKLLLFAAKVQQMQIDPTSEPEWSNVRICADNYTDPQTVIKLQAAFDAQDQCISLTDPSATKSAIAHALPDYLNARKVLAKDLKRQKRQEVYVATLYVEGSLEADIRELRYKAQTEERKRDAQCAIDKLEAGYQAFVSNVDSTITRIEAILTDLGIDLQTLSSSD
jgi:hypothetical protein